MESGIKERGKRTHKGMCDKEIAPFLRSQFLKSIHHFVVISFEAGNRFLAWKTAEGLRVFIQVMAHDQQANRVSWFILASTFPTCEITFGHINHMTHHIADLPFCATCLYVPVIGIVHEVKEISTLFADDIQYSVFTAVIHRVNRGHFLSFFNWPFVQITYRD